MDLDSGRWGCRAVIRRCLSSGGRLTASGQGCPASGSCQRCQGEGALSSDDATKRPPEAHKPIRTRRPARRCHNGWHFPAGPKKHEPLWFVQNPLTVCRRPHTVPPAATAEPWASCHAPLRRGAGPCRASPSSVRTLGES